MDGDPWWWNVQDVTDFFHRHAEDSIRDLPNSRLPSPDHFTAVLAENEVSGAILLTAVDTGFLREDCGIKSLATRSAVIHCIRRLQARSSGFRGRNGDTESGAPASAVLTPTTAAAPSSAPSPAVDSVGDNVRAGETQVEDERGRKRRRLDLSGSASEARPGAEAAEKTVSSDKDDTDGNLPPRKVPIDEVFFGKTAVGKELVQIPPTHPAFIDENPMDFESANFQFVSDTSNESVAAYVHARMRRFLSGREDISVERDGREAFIRYPYRIQLASARVTRLDGSVASPAHYTARGMIKFDSERTAMVVRAASMGTLASRADDRLVATREPEVLLKGGAFFDGYTAEHAALLQGEYSYLLDKYPADNSTLRPSEDNSSDVASIVTDANGYSETASQLGDDQAEEDDDDALGSDEVNSIIGEAVASFSEKWASTVLPRLEAKEAWSTWKRMKKSRTIRDSLIEQAQSIIAQLEARLERFRQDIVAQQWADREALVKQCEVFEVTVADREKQQWKIGIWQRKQEPEHTARISAAQKTPHGTGVSARKDILQSALRGLGPEDRLSLSPVPGADQPPPLFSTEDMVVEAEKERYYTPEGSPPPLPHSSSPPFIVDEADEAEEADESDQEHDPQRDFSADEHTPRMPRSMPATPSSKLQNLKHEQASQMPLPSAESPTLPSRASGSISRSSAQVVDLTGLSSSTPEKPTSKKYRKKQKTKAESKAAKIANSSRHPDEAEAATVDAWNYEDLAEQSDRRRLLIKLFRDTPPAIRKAIHDSFQSLMMTPFLRQLTLALQRLKGDEQGSKGLEAARSEAILHCARMGTAWYLLRPELRRASSFANVSPLPNEYDLRQFVDQLRIFMQKKDSKMFVNHKATSVDAPVEVYSTDDHGGESTRRIEADEDDEDLSDVDGPIPESAKKRKKVQMSQPAVDQRKAGQARMARHKDLQSQSSNAMQLQSMIPAESSHSAIEINLDRPSDADPIYVHPTIAKKMKAHQAEGVQFMWREIAADGGCVLTHTMGLGKTMQAITLLVGINEASRSTHASVYSQLPKRLQLGEQRDKRQLRFLILCPPMLLTNWRREIEQWAPAKVFSEVYTITTTRAKAGEAHFATTLKQWSRRGGLLCIGYSILRGLLDRKREETEKDSEMWSSVDEILMNEAEMVVADEAHNFKNAKSALYRAVQSINTNARIALTGTPMSNDVDEIFALVSWVSPGYLGDPREFSGRFAIPIKEGLYADSTRTQKRQSLKKLRVLHSEIAPKVNRADITVLKGVLKSKTEFILTVELTEKQRQAYTRYVNALTGEGRNTEASQVAIFAWLSVVQLLLNHPSAYREKLLTPVPPKKKAKQDLDLPEDGLAPDDGAISPARNAEEEGADVSVDGFDGKCISCMSTSRRLWWMLGYQCGSILVLLGIEDPRRNILLVPRSHADYLHRTGPLQSRTHEAHY